MDETYIKVGGKDRYLYRAVDKYGYTVDFLLTKRRMKGSAQKFLNKASSLSAIFEAFKESKHVQFPCKLMLKDVLIQEDRIIKSIKK
jgi:transposase-like protein